ncbi:MAG TPA: GAF domain-containing protein [Gemmatimonadales bacterium]|nr:GAF domain-containing protein [Gemmatimonadales bacterium]
MNQQPAEAAAALAARVEDLEREHERLLAIVDILQEISGTLHFVDILQAIARKLGEAFGLDRASVILSDRGGRTARLVASYEDPTIRNLVIDLERYPEIQRAMQTGETVFIADAASEAALQHVKGALDRRKVRSITVVPIKYRGAAIGCFFLRTFKDGQNFSDADIRFFQVVAELTAKALRNAHRYESLVKRSRETSEELQRSDRERLALVAFLQRLLAAFTQRDQAAMEQLLPASSAAELDRLVAVAMAVLAEEAKG